MAAVKRHTIAKDKAQATAAMLCVLLALLPLVDGVGVFSGNPAIFPYGSGTTDVDLFAGSAELDDGSSAAIVLPKPFKMFNSSFSNYWVNVNGYVVGGPKAGNSHTPNPLPYQGVSNSFFVYWQDLDLTGGNGNIYSRADGTMADHLQAQALLTTTLNRPPSTALDFVSVTTWAGVGFYPASNANSANFQLMLAVGGTSSYACYIYGTIPAANVAPSGVNSRAGYQWQSSPTAFNWVELSGSGSATFAPQSLPGTKAAGTLCFETDGMLSPPPKPSPPPSSPPLVNSPPPVMAKLSPPPQTMANPPPRTTAMLSPPPPASSLPTQAGPACPAGQIWSNTMCKTCTAGTYALAGDTICRSCTAGTSFIMTTLNKNTCIAPSSNAQGTSCGPLLLKAPLPLGLGLLSPACISMKGGVTVTQLLTVILQLQDSGSSLSFTSGAVLRASVGINSLTFKGVPMSIAPYTLFSTGLAPTMMLISFSIPAGAMLAANSTAASGIAVVGSYLSGSQQTCFQASLPIC